MHSRRLTFERCDILAEHLRRRAGFFDENRFGRAARQSLEPERPRPGTQIEATRTGKVRREPVEQRFPNSLRRGPQAGNIGDTQKAAAPFSRYNTQPSRLGLFAGLRVSLCHSPLRLVLIRRAIRTV